MDSATSKTSVMAPFIIMLFLYFIVGLFTVINQQFQLPLKSAMLPHDGNMTNALVTLLNFSWFLAYPFSEGFATRWVARLGYRKTSVYSLLIFIAGLGLYEAAVLLHMYAPSYITILGNRIFTGFFIFLLGSFVIGMAVTILQVVTGLYLDVNPVGKTTPLQRQMIGGTTNSIGMAIGPLVVSYVIFYGIPLHNVQSPEFIRPVIVLIAVIVAITLITARIPMPTVNRASRSTTQPTQPTHKSIWSFPQLRLGVIGIFCYVGVEVAVGANINLYAASLNTTFAAAATKMAALYWAGILVGRFIGSVYTKISSQHQLVYSSIGSVLLLLLAMFFANPWILVAIGLFHSVMWPAIYTLALDKLGIYTAKASGALMIGVVGGGVIPLLQGILADTLQGDWRWTWWLVVAGEIYILYYGLSGYKAQSALGNSNTPQPPSLYK